MLVNVNKAPSVKLTENTSSQSVVVSFHAFSIFHSFWQFFLNKSILFAGVCICIYSSLLFYFLVMDALFICCDKVLWNKWVWCDEAVERYDTCLCCLFSLCSLLDLVALWPIPWRISRKKRNNGKQPIAKFILVGLFVCLWRYCSSFSCWRIVLFNVWLVVSLILLFICYVFLNVTF